MQTPNIKQVLQNGLDQPLSKTRAVRLLRRTIVIMRKSAKARGDLKTYNALKGNATAQALEIVERSRKTQK